MVIIDKEKQLLSNEEKKCIHSDYISYYKFFRSEGFIQLKELQTLADVSKIYNISKPTLINRLKKLEEGKDYRKLGDRQPILLTPKAVEKIINIKGVEL